MSALLIEIHDHVEAPADEFDPDGHLIKITDDQMLAAVAQLARTMDIRTIECASAGPNALYLPEPIDGEWVKIGTWTWVR